MDTWQKHSWDIEAMQKDFGTTKLGLMERAQKLIGDDSARKTKSFRKEHSPFLQLQTFVNLSNGFAVQQPGQAKRPPRSDCNGWFYS